MNSIMDSPNTNFEVESTYGTCSGTPGPDGFRSKLIDNANREAMTKCLLILWQEAWSQGVFLKDWKKEHRAVLPKPNKDDYNQCNSYRTVSLTAILGKRYEKISSNRLKTYLDSIGFDSKQHAYLLNGKSSTQALLKLTEKIKVLSLEIDGLAIEQKKIFPYLGVILNQKLTFQKHIESICSKALGAMRKLSGLFQKRRGISVKLGLQLYIALVRPHLEYAAPVSLTNIK